MHGRGSGRALALAAVSLILLVPAGLPSGLTLAGAQSAAPAPAGSATVAGAELASRVEARKQDLAHLQQQVAETQAQLVTASAAADHATAAATGEQQRAAQLVASAREQALSSYIHGDPASQPYALAAALGQADMNDVAWTLGLLKVTNEHTAELARAAQSAKATADAGLTDALAQRDQLQAQLNNLTPLVETANQQVQAAEAELSAYVSRLGPATVDGMTTVAYDAYQRAATRVAVEQPACGLRWELLAAIGMTESHHGAGRLAVDGTATSPILGIPIGPDTDAGALDTDAGRDHAVGPMQFIPSTWQRWGVDANADGKADPENVYDAALAAGRYLCAAAGSLTLATREGVIRAIWAYNPNEDYLRVVGERYEALASDVARGWFSTGDLPVPAAAPPDAPSGADGGAAPAADTPVPAPTPTAVHTVAVFTATGLAVASAGGVVPATCDASAAVPGRAGLLRCATSPADGSPSETLDPCYAAPYDATLAACIPNPDQPARLVRAGTPLPTAPVSPAPPYLRLELAGGDRCTPLVPAGAPAAAPVATTVAPTPTPTLAPAVRNPDAVPVTPAALRAPATTTRVPGVANPDAVPLAAAALGAPATTTTKRSATTTTTTAVATTTTTVAATTTTAPAPTPTTAAPAAPTTAAPPTTTAAGPAGTYRCASGATLTDQPNTAAPVWKVTVVQPGVAPRAVDVIAAWA